MTRIVIDESSSPDRAESRRRWAQLIQRVFEVDPLECPRCGGAMKILGFIEHHQRDTLERILRHLGLWEHHGSASRAPPARHDRSPARHDRSRPVSEPRYVHDADVHDAEQVSDMPDVDAPDEVNFEQVHFEL
jgi:hypothetical protein